MTNLIVFDTETSGVDVLEDRIVQLYIGVYTKHGEPVQSFEWFINPGVEVPKEASDVHGFSNEFLKENGIDPAVALGQAIKVFRTYWKDVWVAYNLAFDLSILHAEMVRHGVADRFGPVVADKVRLFDPYVTDRHKDKYRKGPRKLVNVAEHYGLDFDPEALHDAGADCELTALVANAVFSRYGLPTNADQAAWYRQWATGFRDDLRKQGKAEDDVQGVSLQWPLRVRLDGE